LYNETKIDGRFCYYSDFLSSTKRRNKTKKNRVLLTLVYILHNSSATRQRNNMEKNPKFISSSTEDLSSKQYNIKETILKPELSTGKKKNDNNKKKQKRLMFACNRGRRIRLEIRKVSVSEVGRS